jgi:hypothetical protein
MSDKSYKVRVYGEKPIDPAERHIEMPWSETYDECEP